MVDTCKDIRIYLLKYSKASIIILVALALISSFILVGGIFFLPLNSMPVPSPIFFRFKIHELALYFLLASFLFVSFIYCCEKLDKFSFKNMLTQTLTDRKKVYLQNVGIFMFIGLIAWACYFPVRHSADVENVIQQIKSNNFHTHHTVLYPALNKLLWSIVQIFTKNERISIGFLSLVPYFTFSLIYSLWFDFFYRYGISKKNLRISFILFFLSPNNFLQMAFLWKDVLYTQSLFLIIYMFILLYIQKAKYPYLIGFGALLSFTLMIRFNGVGVYFLGLLLLGIESFKQKQKKIILAPLLTSIFCLLLVNVVVFKALNFKNTLTVHKVGLILQPINTAYLYGIEDQLHPEILKLTQAKGIDQEIWKKALFNYVSPPLLARDFMFKMTDKEYYDFMSVVKYLSKDNRTFIKYYLYTWIGSPLIALRTRLNFIQTSWSIHGHHQTLAEMEILNMGLVTLLLLFYAAYCFIRKKYIHLVILFPWLANLAVLFLVSTATDYRYFWICKWTFLVSIFMLFISFDKDNIKEYHNG